MPSASSRAPRHAVSASLPSVSSSRPGVPVITPRCARPEGSSSSRPGPQQVRRHGDSSPPSPPSALRTASATWAAYSSSAAAAARASLSGAYSISHTAHVRALHVLDARDAHGDLRPRIGRRQPWTCARLVRLASGRVSLTGTSPSTHQHRRGGRAPSRSRIGGWCALGWVSGDSKAQEKTSGATSLAVRETNMPGASGSSARLRRVTSALHRDARSSSTFRRDCAAADSSRKFCIVRDDAGWRQYITRLTPMFDAATAVPKPRTPRRVAAEIGRDETNSHPPLSR